MLSVTKENTGKEVIIDVVSDVFLLLILSIFSYCYRFSVTEFKQVVIYWGTITKIKKEQVIVTKS